MILSKLRCSALDISHDLESVLEDGELLSFSSWDYKIPGIAELPQIFEVALYANQEFKEGVLNSKASGEPPLLLANSVHTAIRMAIGAGDVA